MQVISFLQMLLSQFTMPGPFQNFTWGSAPLCLETERLRACKLPRKLYLSVKALLSIRLSPLLAGLMAANDGRFEEAERFFQIVLKEDQQSASAWSNIGNVHLSLGRPQDAIKEFTQAIALAPEVTPAPFSHTHSCCGCLRDANCELHPSLLTSAKTKHDLAQADRCIVIIAYRRQCPT